MELAESLRQIHNLVFTYAELVDEADFDGLVSMFEHATLSADGRDGLTAGADAIREHFAGWVKVYPEGTLRTQHLITNVIVDIEEHATQASGRSYYTVLQATDGLPLQPIISGRYRDTYEVIDGRWRFTHRRYFGRLYGDLRHHLGRQLRR